MHSGGEGLGAADCEAVHLAVNCASDIARDQAMSLVKLFTDIKQAYA